MKQKYGNYANQAEVDSLLQVLSSWMQYDFEKRADIQDAYLYLRRTNFFNMDASVRDWLKAGVVNLLICFDQ